MTESTSQPNVHSRRGNGRPSDTHEEDGLKLTCCGCMDIRRGVILTLWVQFAIVMLAAIGLLVFLVALANLVTFDDEPGGSTGAADAKANADGLRLSMWIYFGIYLALSAFTCAGLATVKFRKLALYRAFVAVNVVIFAAEIVLSIVMQPFQVLTIVGLVLRAYWVWVFYRYIATLAMEIAHIERQKELEVELYR